MYCQDCGARLTEGARFCPECGRLGKPPRRPRRRAPSRDRWLALAAAAIVVVALAIALPLLLGGGQGPADDTVLVSSTTLATTASTTAAATPSTEPATPSSEPPVTTTAPAGDIPGDSAGTWAEVTISGLDQDVSAVALSEEALLFQTLEGTRNSLFAYVFASGETVRLPTLSDWAGMMDVEGTLAVWGEAQFDASDHLTEAHVYAYPLPGGPRVEVASGTKILSPQVAGRSIAWSEGAPSTTRPDEYWEQTIRSVVVDEQGRPVGAPLTLVEAATASVAGDSTWTWSLSDGLVAWEQHSSSGAVDAGSYLMELGEMRPWRIEGEAWRPNLSGGRAVFTRDGVEVTAFGGDEAARVDGAGDFATAGPTYAAYFRPTPSGDGTTWSVVTRGLTGAHEQVLLEGIASPPWFQSPIAASATRVAFTIDGVMRVFSWQ